MWKHVQTTNYLLVDLLTCSVVSGPKIASVLTMASDQSAKEEAENSANHRTPLTSQTEGEQCQQIKTERCESDGRDDGNELLLTP